MAFGIPPRYSTEFDLGTDSPEHFITACAEAIKELRWDLGTIHGNALVAHTGFSMSSWSEKITAVVRDQRVKITSECTGSQIIDWGKNKRNVEDLVLVYGKKRATVTPEHLSSGAVAIQLNEAYTEDDHNLTRDAAEKSVGFFYYFIPSKNYFITPIIVNLNIIIFLAMVISGANLFLPDSDTLIAWGANYRPATLEGGWWRLFTSNFIHIGIIHLLFNMYGLIYIGLYLEPLMGRLNFAVAYCLTGILASVASFYWHGLTVSAGASGAIFGVYGVFFAMLTTDMIERSARRALLVSMSVFIGYNLINGLRGGIDNAAHIGGLVSGLIIGYSYYPILTNAYHVLSTSIIIGVLSLGTLGTTAYVYTHTPDIIKEYTELMKEFSINESLALEIYSRDSTRTDDLANELKNRGIYYWKENLALLAKIDKLGLPEAVGIRNQKLIHYCNLQLELFNLYYKKITEKTDHYKPEIEKIQEELKEILEYFKANS